MLHNNYGGLRRMKLISYLNTTVYISHYNAQLTVAVQQAYSLADIKPINHQLLMLQLAH